MMPTPSSVCISLLLTHRCYSQWERSRRNTALYRVLMGDRAVHLQRHRCPAGGRLITSRHAAPRRAADIVPPPCYWCLWQTAHWPIPAGSSRCAVSETKKPLKKSLSESSPQVSRRIVYRNFTGSLPQLQLIDRLRATRWTPPDYWQTDNSGDGHSQLPLAELGKPTPKIDLLHTTGSNGRV